MFETVAKIGESELSKKDPEKTNKLPDEISKTPGNEFKPPWVGNTDIKDNRLDSIKIAYGSGMEAVDKEDLEKATQIVKESILFIRDNAGTDVEEKTLSALEAMLIDGKVLIADTSQDLLFPVYGYFNPDGKEDGCIVIDYDAVLSYGEAETIDTIIHESYHAAQYMAGHKNDLVEEETRAWNIGLEMSNNYREGNNEFIVQTEPYSQNNIEDMGYSRTYGKDIFTELKTDSVEGIV